jgi:hypothetical protein
VERIHLDWAVAVGSTAKKCLAGMALVAAQDNSRLVGEDKDMAAAVAAGRCFAADLDLNGKVMSRCRKNYLSNLLKGCISAISHPLVKDFKQH